MIIIDSASRKIIFYVSLFLQNWPFFTDHSIPLCGGYNTFGVLTDRISSESLAEKKDDIIELLSNFVSGDYKVCKYVADPENSGYSNRRGEYVLEFPSLVQKEKEEASKKEYSKYFNDALEKNEHPIIFDIVSKTTEMYTVLQDPIISLWNKRDYDENLVHKYEQMILAEEYPYCLLYSSFIENEDSDYLYCLHGIEKILAYQKLGKHLRVIEIKKISPAYKKMDLNLIALLSEYLFTWQLKSVFEEDFNDVDTVKTIKSLGNHPFRPFIKDGYVEEYWINGTIKSKGNYQDNQPHGVIEYYYENGSLKSKWLYENGDRIRPEIEYYQTGQVRSVFNFYEDENYGRFISYDINGVMSHEAFYNEGVFYIMKNGQYYIKDGKSMIYYHPNGREKLAEYYKDGKRIHWEKFDTNGELIEKMDLFKS